jgi:hypothetical protein
MDEISVCVAEVSGRLVIALEYRDSSVSQQQQIWRVWESRLHHSNLRRLFSSVLRSWCHVPSEVWTVKKVGSPSSTFWYIERFRACRLTIETRGC